MNARIVAMLLIAGSLSACVTTGQPDYTAAFVAQTRGEAHTLEAKGALADARLRWRYVAALSPNDAEAASEIARLNGVIRDRRDALVRQGDAALKAGRAVQARTFYLKALALDGTDARARGGLADMDGRLLLANQEKKDQKDQKAMSEYMAQVHNAQTPDSAHDMPPHPAQAQAQVPAPDLGPPAYDPLKR
jgi:Flp pilus assembly protein TadD